MIQKLYKKLYLYTIAILITAVIFTALTVNLITRRDVEHRMEEPFADHITLLKSLVADVVEKDPANIQSKLDRYTKMTKWNISYWKGNNCVFDCTKEQISYKSAREFSQLISEKRTQVIHRHDAGPVILTYLNKFHLERGFIIVSLNDMPHPPPRMEIPLLTGLFILIFLGLLLVPYTKFVLSPFVEVMHSINYVAAGNFSTIIEVNQKNEFREVAEAFNNMTLKIRDMMNQKQRMIADVSHELRTPLSKIRLCQELLLKEGKANQKYVDRSITETENLDNIINDLLDASELEMNPDRFKLVKIDFKEIINENIEKNQLLFQEKGFTINRNFSEQDMPVKVEKHLIERAFNNIFSNIIKYVPQNSSIDLTLKKENNKAVLTVRDYGPGVEREHLEKLFDPFYRTDDSRSRTTGGTGLGLSIVKKIIELHEGRIWADKPSDDKSGLILNIEIALTK